MISSNKTPLTQKGFSLQNYINKITPNKIRLNTRYDNVQNKSSAPIAAINNYNKQYNNQFVYKSENIKGYNKMTVPSISHNSDIKLINPKTSTNISKGLTTPNSLNWNNIGYKEIKFKNNIASKTYRPNITNNNYLNKNTNNLFQSYDPTASNLGFHDINTGSKKYRKNNNNFLYSKKTGLINTYGNTVTYNNNTYNNNIQKNSLSDYYKNMVQIRSAREGINSKVIKNRMNNEENIKKISKIQAIWKGIYVRELMSYYWNFNQFQYLLEKFFIIRYKKQFLINLKKKDLTEEFNKKQKEIDKLKNDYNNILKQFNEYKKNQEKNKEENNIKLRIVNDKKNINNYLEHFKSNLKIINNDTIIFERIQKEKIFEINHTFLSLICNHSKEKLIEQPEKKELKTKKIYKIEKQKEINIINIVKEKKIDKNNIYIEKNCYFDIFNKKEKKDDNIIKLKQVKEPKKEKKQLLLISNQNNFIIKNKEIKKEDKMIETNKEIKKEKEIIKPDNKSEILLKGKENNIIFIKENKSIEYKKETKNILKNYNSVNEIEKGDALEINPYEIKRTKKDIKVSQENKIEVIISNNIFTEKSKKNLVKILFAIKLKAILIKYIKKKFFSKLIQELKKILFISILDKVKLNYEKRNKKKGIEKIKENVIIIKLKKYLKEEIEKDRLKYFVKKYLKYKWNQGLVDLSKIIIGNKK